MPSFDKTVPAAPVHAGSALVIALADWLVFGVNIATRMHAYWAINVSTALGAGVLVALVQRLSAKNAVREALLKGLGAFMIVVLPLPLTGSAVALALLTWAWMSSLSRHS
jgi:hypothetical protein